MTLFRFITGSVHISQVISVLSFKQAQWQWVPVFFIYINPSLFLLTASVIQFINYFLKYDLIRVCLFEDFLPSVSVQVDMKTPKTVTAINLSLERHTDQSLQNTKKLYNRSGCDYISASWPPYMELKNKTKLNMAGCGENNINKLIGQILHWMTKHFPFNHCLSWFCINTRPGTDVTSRRCEVYFVWFDSRLFPYGGEIVLVKRIVPTCELGKMFSLEILPNRVFLKHQSFYLSSNIWRSGR